MKAVTCLFVYLLFFIPLSFAKDTVRYTSSVKYPDTKQQYFIDTLTLALEATKDDYGDYELLPIELEIPQGRTSALVESGNSIDISWRMTSAELEQRLMPIPIPLLKGLMGYRIGIIREGDQQRFPSNITEGQLQQIIIGQGYDWPDTVILRENGMTVIEGFAHTLLTMLEQKRFDLFLRALHEPWVEIKDKSEFTVEKNILVQYPAPMFFFVNRNNNRLYERLTVGLNQSIDDGSFQTLFENHPVTADIVSRANLEQRKVFKLSNPLLSDETQKLIGDKRLWH
ncbi:hypothetical protein [Neptuniibacter sp.]|uniref:hypothetical protein n=1 Tax=Neptuniibacter sp. TaxID=1962643 RepID=UPI002624A29B|nr:hypothetical protein [Neptuniibacter sp.]MCP4596466.1 hypothetical protein [Neptuniibacter sp.]